MKKIISFISSTSLLIACILWSGCKKENPSLYNSPAMIYVFKSSTNPYKDSMTYSFSLKPFTLTQDTVYISVRIIGDSTGRDRVISLVSDTANTTAILNTNYSLLPDKYVIPKDSFSASLPVIIKRSTDIQTKEVRLWVKLVSSNDFQTGIDNQLTYLIKINDMVTKPADWDLYAGKSTYFGAWTSVKYRFIISVTGVTDFGSSPVSPPPGSTIPVPGNQMLFYRSQVVNALAIYNANPVNNPPLKDENGNIVTIP